MEKKLGEIALNICTGKKNNEDKTYDGKYPFFVRSQQLRQLIVGHMMESYLLYPAKAISEIFFITLSKNLIFIKEYIKSAILR